MAAIGAVNGRVLGAGTSARFPRRWEAGEEGPRRGHVARGSAHIPEIRLHEHQTRLSLARPRPRVPPSPPWSGCRGGPNAREEVRAGYCRIKSRPWPQQRHAGRERAHLDQVRLAHIEEARWTSSELDRRRTRVGVEEEGVRSRGGAAEQFCMLGSLAGCDVCRLAREKRQRQVLADVAVIDRVAADVARDDGPGRMTHPGSRGVTDPADQAVVSRAAERERRVQDDERRGEESAGLGGHQVGSKASGVAGRDLSRPDAKRIRRMGCWFAADHRRKSFHK
jgi:hypothetical protein